MTRYYSSTAQPTTLSAAATDVATTIQVTATTGFPAVEFILALDYGTAQQELVKVTNVAGATLTVVRGFDSTTAQAHSLGAAVRHVHSADDFRLSRTHEATSSGVHGVTGALVGTSDAQALTNKDLTSGTNTFPASLATDAELSAHTGATAAHGTTGAIVGTSDAQTLTNKTVALGSNTVSGTTAQFNAALSDNDFATLAGTETLTNKTLTSPTLTSPTISGDVIGVTRGAYKNADQSTTSTTAVQVTNTSVSTVANGIYLVTIHMKMNSTQGQMIIGTGSGTNHGTLYASYYGPSGTLSMEGAQTDTGAAATISAAKNDYYSGIYLAPAVDDTLVLKMAGIGGTSITCYAGSFITLSRIA